MKIGKIPEFISIKVGKKMKNKIELRISFSFFPLNEGNFINSVKIPKSYYVILLASWMVRNKKFISTFKQNRQKFWIKI